MAHRQDFQIGPSPQLSPPLKNKKNFFQHCTSRSKKLFHISLGGVECYTFCPKKTSSRKLDPWPEKNESVVVITQSKEENEPATNYAGQTKKSRPPKKHVRLLLLWPTTNELWEKRSTHNNCYFLPDLLEVDEAEDSVVIAVMLLRVLLALW